jgi:hypothetical protein
MRTWSFSCMSRRLRAILLAGLASGVFLTAGATDKMPNSDVQELKRRGQALHEAVLELDHSLRDSKSLSKTAGFIGLDISDLIAKYIPVGTPLSEADEILRAAGYKVNTSVLVRGSEPQRIASATLSLAKGLFWARDSLVQLYLPPDRDAAQPGASVVKISANISTQGL